MAYYYVIILFTVIESALLYPTVTFNNFGTHNVTIQNFVTSGSITPPDSYTLRAGHNYSVTVGSGGFNGQFYLQSPLDSSGNHIDPCPNTVVGCDRLTGTRAVFTFPPSDNPTAVTTYQILADGGTRPYTYNMYIKSTSGACAVVYSRGQQNNTIGKVPSCSNTVSYVVDIYEPKDGDNDGTPTDGTPEDGTPTEAPVEADCTEGNNIMYVNNCTEEIWILPANNAGSPGTIPEIPVHIPIGGSYVFPIPTIGWIGRFATKGGCNAAGYECTVGQSLNPCPSFGCTPPASLFTEFNFPKCGVINGIQYFDISAVDGFDIFPVIIEPVNTTYDVGGLYTEKDFNCSSTAFSLNASTDCPVEQDFYQNTGPVNVTADLHSSNRAHCLAPCQKAVWPNSTYTATGFGMDITLDPAASYCCPAGVKTPDQCRAGIIKNTNYYKLIKSTILNKYTYSYCYDDDDGTFICPQKNSFVATVCPSKDALSKVKPPEYNVQQSAAAA